MLMASRAIVLIYLITPNNFLTPITFKMQECTDSLYDVMTLYGSQSFQLKSQSRHRRHPHTVIVTWSYTESRPFGTRINSNSDILYNFPLPVRRHTMNKKLIGCELRHDNKIDVFIIWYQVALLNHVTCMATRMVDGRASKRVLRRLRVAGVLHTLATSGRD